jgi:hypothetical protein
VRAKLKLIEVRDPGKQNERVFIRALQEVDLGDYIVTDTTYRQDGSVSNKARHVYEFARKVVQAGEYVCLHSGAGSYKLDKTTDDGTPLHRFYWGLNYTIWNKSGDNAWLLYAPLSERQGKAVAPATSAATR